MRVRFLLALVLGLATACSNATDPDAFQVTITSGDGQTGVQNTVLPEPIGIQVTGANGEPAVSARLSLTPTPGSGIVLGADSVTDALGRASLRWELGESWENHLTVALRDHPESSASVRAHARYRLAAPDQTDDRWETASPIDVGFNGEQLTRMMDSLRAGTYPEVHSVVIVKEGKLVFEAYFPGHDFGYASPDYLGNYVVFGRDTRHNTHSATKSVISALVGLAIDQGLVPDEDAKVFEYFPDYASDTVGGKGAITVRDMLTMSSGLEWHEWGVSLAQSSIDAFNRSADPIGYVLGQPLLSPPGAAFNYSGGTVNVLCQLVARAAGTSVDSFAHQYLFGPLGVSNYDFPHHITGITVCHGDIYITPRDMAKFGQLYLNGGTWGGERILSQEWIKRSWMPWMSVRDFYLSWATGYGYLWWLRDYSVGGHTYSTFKALGWGGQEIWVVPSEDMVVVFAGANYTRDPPCDHLMTRFILPALGN